MVRQPAIRRSRWNNLSVLFTLSPSARPYDTDGRHNRPHHSADVSAEMNSPSRHKPSRPEDIGAGHVLKIGRQKIQPALAAEKSEADAKRGADQENQRNV